MDLNFSIVNQRLRKTSDDFIVQNSNNYLVLYFTFETNDWDDLSKYVILRNSEHESFQFDYLEDGVIVPSSVVEGNQFYVTVYGADEDTTRVTTNEIGVILADTGYTTDISGIEDEEVDWFVNVTNLLATKFDTVVLEDNIITFSNDTGDILGTVSLDEVTPSAHTHTTSDITDYDTVTSTEIKYSLNQLKNSILSNGSE